MICRLSGCLRQRVFWFALLVATGFAWGVLCTEHYIPAQSDEFVGVQVTVIYALAVFVGAVGKRVNIASGGMGLWLCLLILVAIQPLLHSLPYIDDLLYPLATILLTLMSVFLVANFNSAEKEGLMRVLSVGLFVAGFLTVFTQLAQLMQWTFLAGWVFFSPEPRLIGNVAQVNQAAYVEVLAMVAALYWTQTGKTPLRVYGLAALLLFFLSIGIGFSASRGGFLMALIVIPVASWLFAPNAKDALVRSVVLWAVFAAGYIAGTALMHHFSTQEISSVSRLAGGDHQRFLIYTRAFMAFLERPLLGIGWGQFNAFGVTHAQDLKFFGSVTNAHMLPFQIAAELGVMGLLVLLGFAVILWKAFRQNQHSNGQKLAAIVVFVTLMYSCTEFPLWFMRYLIPFAVCMAVLDPTRMRLNFNYGILLAILGAACCAIAVYYVQGYEKYIKAYYQSKTNKEVYAKLQTLPRIFGFTSYREAAYFSVTDTASKENILKEQIAVGNRVVRVFPTTAALSKLADFYLFAHQTDEAQYYYQAACLFDYARECDGVVAHLRTELKPEYAAQVLPTFGAWYRARFERDLPQVKLETASGDGAAHASAAAVSQNGTQSQAAQK